MGQHKSPAFSRLGTNKNRDLKEILLQQPMVFLDDTADFLLEIDKEVKELEEMGRLGTPKQKLNKTEKDI